MRYAYARYIIIVREYVGASICLPHTCNLCGKSADEFRHHDLSYRSSQGRTSHYHMLNNVIHRSLSSANIPSRLEPSSLYRADGNRPDGVTMVPWSNGRLLVWDSFVTPTIKQSPRKQVGQQRMQRLRKSRRVRVTLTLKEAHLDQAYQFQPITVETCGAVGPDSMCFLCDLGKRLKSATGEPNPLPTFSSRSLWESRSAI